MIQVYIIECVNPEIEDQIGIQCAERFIYPRAEQENIGISVGEPKDKYEIIKLLNDAYHEMKTMGRPCPPIVLHIDSHGNDDGFLTRNEELFTWKELSPFCQQLSRISNIQLIMIMGTCSGAYSMEMLKPYDIAPYYCTFGPRSNIGNRQLMDFYRDFYNELLTYKKIDVVTQHIINKYRDVIMHTSSFYLFQSLYKNYLFQQRNKFGIQRKNKMIRKIKKLPILRKNKEKSMRYLNKTGQLTVDLFPQFRKQFS